MSWIKKSRGSLSLRTVLATKLCSHSLAHIFHHPPASVLFVHSIRVCLRLKNIYDSIALSRSEARSAKIATDTAWSESVASVAGAWTGTARAQIAQWRSGDDTSIALWQDMGTFCSWRVRRRRRRRRRRSFLPKRSGLAQSSPTVSSDF